ncbi:helix-turn-helix domain-containing protein [Enterococcus sp. MJM12]|uniref:Helix-turn-helix domain-containing protein n=1 Tax=Candidatus Enterococcus myersii TaxID=2815322 RepID=A0ABS3H957_9ENTE|nr:helix-turn-helix domain-containing protein [Enterococcus sp. MJM12]MBO0449430.1 helix-turn-helix domain-containing protein [Enterococcus sp. MJM12]
MVYQCLLERDERAIWQIYSLGQRGELVAYEHLQAAFHFAKTKIQRLCDWWAEIEEKEAVGIYFTPQNAGIQVELADHFCQTRLWQRLLSESLTFHLLWQKLNDPLVTITQLSQQHYIARKTVWRRLEGLRPLWLNFNLRLDDNFQSCLMGLESQKRYLILQLKKMQMLPFERDSAALLSYMQELSLKRQNFGFKLTPMEAKILHSRAPQLPYQIDERGWLYLLRQLLGNEIWLPKSYQTFVTALENHPHSLGLTPTDTKEIYRYHLCLQLFCGDSFEEFLTPRCILSEAYLIQEFSEKYVDKYARFTRNHRYVVNGYDYALKKKSSSLEFA